MQQRAQLVAVRHVEKCRRLVEQDHGRGLREGAGYHHALTLAVGERVDHAVGKTCHAGRGHRLIDDAHIFGAGASQPVGVGRASYGDQLACTHVLGVYARCVDERYAPCRLGGIHLPERPAVDPYLASLHIAQRSHGAQQRTLARTVAAEQRRNRTASEGGRGRVDQSPLPERQPYIA